MYEVCSTSESGAVSWDPLLGLEDGDRGKDANVSN